MSLKKAINQVSVPAPAKVNLFLSVLGKRADGYHDLVSVVAKLRLYDLVTVETVAEENSLSCDCLGETALIGIRNLAEDAVSAWRQATGVRVGIRVVIDKRIPLQAGLGGGSSNAVATLLGLNSMMESPMGLDQLMGIASKIGSDCPSFLLPDLCIMRGRGERMSGVHPKRAEELKGRRIILFKPSLGFPTEEIYELMARGGKYSRAEDANQRLEDWEKGRLSLEELLSNDLESAVFSKYLFVPELFELLRNEFSLRPLVSGSGSCCFCIGSRETPWKEVEKSIRKAWGSETFVEVVDFV